ncbi:hypothetical protein MMC17_000669 [Xylographa soralifera]|nr:hypothetical protein [Xylographa soralifera]
MDAAAGTVAFASITIQLGQSFVALYQYWESIKEAPADISTVVRDLKHLAAILHQIELDGQKFGQPPEMTDILRSCMAKRRLQRKWTALKAVLKNNKVGKFRKSLEETKTTMLLARLSSQERLQSMRFQSSDEKLSSIVSTLGSLQLQQSSRTVTTTSAEYYDGDEQWTALRPEIKRMASEMPNPVYRAGFEHAMHYSLRQIRNNAPKVNNDHPFAEKTKQIGERTPSHELPWNHRKKHQQLSSYNYSIENVFGKVVVNSTTSLKQSVSDPENDVWENRQLYEHKMTISIQPAWWLVKIGFNHGLKVAFLRSTAQGVKIALDPFRLVPRNALIFDFCYTGNIDGVRRLLQRGEASPRDTDSLGRTPLYIAASGCHTELSRLLIDAGADKAPSSCNAYGDSMMPLLAVAKTDRYVNYQQKIDTLRLLSDQLDVLDENYYFLHLLLQSSVPSHLDLRGNGPIAAWAAGYYFPMFMTYLARVHWLPPFYGSRVLEALIDTILTIHHIDPTSIVSLVMVADAGSIRILLNKGLNPHLVASCFIDDYPAELLTLTSYAMWNRRTFDVWGTELKNLGTNLDDFVQEEMKLGSMVETGWTTKSLLNLFNQEFMGPDSRQFKCSICPSYTCLFEPAWWIELDKIRTTGGCDKGVTKVSTRLEDNVRWQDIPYDFTCFQCLKSFTENDYKPFPVCPGCGYSYFRPGRCLWCHLSVPIEDFEDDEDQDDGFSPFKLF